MDNETTMTQSAKPVDAHTEPHNIASVEVRPRRRRFTQAEKIAILEEFDGRERGSRGLYLRQKGLHSSVVYGWRKELRVGLGLQSKKRGTKARSASDSAAEIVKLRRQLAQSEEVNRQMQLIIDVQKKLSQILGVTLPAVAQ